MPELLTNAGFDLVLMSLLFVSFLFYIVMRMKKQTADPSHFRRAVGCLFIWTLGALLLLRDHLIGLSVRPWTVQLAYVGLILTPVAALYVGIVFCSQYGQTESCPSGDPHRPGFVACYFVHEPVSSFILSRVLI
jgi:hypothetical protein